MSARGFTLVELIAVIVLVSILSVVVVPGFTDASLSDVRAARDDLLAALFYSQQIAMARDSGANPVRLSTTSSSVSVTENDTAALHAGTQYPLTLPVGVTLSPAIILDYNKLGETRATTFTITKGGTSAVVNLSASGYAN